jgi:2-polyprenyl-3-methyl-5-hydroxy-6-metoxy-1,4-benzoquinol methylase
MDHKANDHKTRENIVTSSMYGSADFFNRIYREKIPAWGYEPAIFLQESLSTFPEGATILDAGCGTGRNAHYLAEKGFKVYAYDLSDEAIQQANEINSNALFYVKNLAEEDWGSMQYDVVIDFGYFHFFTPDERSHYHTQLNKVLKPGGIYINESGNNTITDVYEPGPDPDISRGNKNPHKYAPPSVKKDEWNEFNYLNIEVLEEKTLPPYKEFGEYTCWNVLARKS